MILIVFVGIFNHCFILLQFNAVLMFHFVASPTRMPTSESKCSDTQDRLRGRSWCSPPTAHRACICNRSATRQTCCCAWPRLLTPEPAFPSPGPPTTPPQDVAAEMHHIHSASVLCLFDHDCISVSSAAISFSHPKWR